MRIHIAIVLILAGFAFSCATTPNTGDLQILVNRLTGDGKEYAPPEAVEAQTRLKQLGTLAFPVLVSNVHDKRPACRCFSGDTSGRATVGDACLDIMSMQVEKYSYRGKAYPAYLTPDSVESWWRDRKGKPLVALQIEAIEWTIAEIETNEHYGFLRKNGLPWLKADLHKLKTKGHPTR
jgi:hypothetical protein